jgi:hypothetical protein
MQRNVDGQFFGFGIEVSRCEVAPFEITPLARNVELDVIVGGRCREILEVVATKDDPHHSRRDVPLLQDGEGPAARVVPNAAGLVFHNSASGWFHL